MNFFKPLQSVLKARGVVLALVCLSAATTARANVYATDIKVNGSLYGITNSLNGAVNITYHLNQAATTVTVNILQGTTNVAAITGGTAMGLNSVSWTPTVNGTYSVSITAAAAGYSIWTQTSLDSTNNVAVDAQGIAIDNNTNSPYYGRIVLGCASSGTQHGITQNCGIYKMNADGSPADEGSFGYGGYTTNDAGGTATGAMSSGSGFNPWRLRIGSDDRLYIDDYSSLGAIVAFDMQVTTNQVVIDDGPEGHLGGPHNYTGNPDFGDLFYGINNFDVTSTSTTNAAVWLCDVDTSPNWGIWMYHMTNGAADTNDTEGTQAVIQSAGSDLSAGSSGGCMIDSNLDIFVSQNTYNNNAVFRTMDYTNWNHGVLPPEKSGSTDAYGTATGQVLWGIGTNDATFEGVQDTVINNSQHPTMVALPMLAGAGNFPGIRVLNATNGSVVIVTNGIGATIQVLTNLDYPNQYSCAAWDNVGNLYGASSSANYWRVWSPPGSNQATTLAVAKLQILGAAPVITSIVVSGTAITINFTAGASDPASAFTLISSHTVNGAYTSVNGASITGGSGSYQATTTVNGSTQFYRLQR